MNHVEIILAVYAAGLALAAFAIGFADTTHDDAETYALIFFWPVVFFIIIGALVGGFVRGR